MWNRNKTRKCIVCSEGVKAKTYHQKTCSKKCGNEYRKQLRTKWGRQSENREILRQTTKDWSEKNKLRKKEYDKKYYLKNTKLKRRNKV
ncbi:MAG: hypothetical protein HYS98_06665 [Deltaproteobacteria bacterium]|nr:hypothetical protein [Deltaproteobacteria bacterium]